MAVIESGDFQMGATEAEERRENDPIEFRGSAMPRHRVSIRRFALGKYDVTRAQFAAFVEESKYATDANCWGLDNGLKLVPRLGASWRNPGFLQTDNDPVVCVNWNDAIAFARWLSGKTGHAYRLPTEAEWEYAARANTTAARYWGDSRERTCEFANAIDLSLLAKLGIRLRNDYYFHCDDRFPYTSPVGSFKPNAFGLFDMLGNVWQWTADCWTENYLDAPSDGNAQLKGDCSRRVARGGSWSDLPVSVRSSWRANPASAVRVYNTGFRVARSF